MQINFKDFNMLSSINRTVDSLAAIACHKIMSEEKNQKKNVQNSVKFFANKFCRSIPSYLKPFMWRVIILQSVWGWGIKEEETIKGILFIMPI